MKTVIQRVNSCVLNIEGQEYSRIGYGLLILLSVEDTDNTEDTEWLCGKIAGLRIFDDDQGVMNLDIKEIGGDIMVVSQFTLHASTRKGNRLSFSKAARPEIARPLYEAFIREFEMRLDRQVATGQFGAHMEITLVNDGPVTIIIDTKNKE
ncbi:MAG: D-aminoacyl-tRNA deacylase [Bacteroidota bacterium]